MNLLKISVSSPKVQAKIDQAVDMLEEVVYEAKHTGLLDINKVYEAANIAAEVSDKVKVLDLTQSIYKRIL